MSSEQKSYASAPAGPCALWPVDLKLTHLDWNPEATLIHFQGQYLTICELDYNILQGEIQNAPKAPAAVDIGEFCLVEDLTSARWYRGRVQNLKKDLYDVFLIDHGNVLSVNEAHISSCSNDLFILPPKIVCGFLSSVLLLPDCCHSVVEAYFTNLIGRNATGYTQALLPHKVLLLEAPDISSDLVRHGFGRHVDTDTFLFLVEMLTEAPLKQNIEPAPDLLIEKQREQEFLKLTSLQGYEEILSSCRPKLKCGSHVTVCVTAAVNPGLFYCQMTDKEPELKELSSKLAAACELKAKVNQLRTPDNLGLLCSVKGKDEKWYRGLVQHLPVNSLVRVLFVDYGYFESVKVENIHKLPPHFCSIPVMSFPCALSCMNSEEEDIKNKQLGFLRTSLLGGILEIEINNYKPEQHLYCITILKTIERITPIQKSPNTKLIYSEQRLPQSEHLYYEKVMSKELDNTLGDEEIQVGSIFAGFVEHVQNPNHFWVRTEKRNYEFEEMMEKLSRHFKRIALDEDILENPEPGMLCCAVYEEDLHYYRGVVVDLLEHGAEVLFIDFGNIGKVPHNLIKKIPEEFADKSAFALCCSLVSVVPMDEFWSSSSTDSFKRLVSNKVLQIRVIQMRKNKLDVDLYDEECGNNVGQGLSVSLISTNQARYGKNISKQSMAQRKLHTTTVKEKITRPNKQPSLHPKASENWNEEEASKEPVTLKALNIKPGCEFAVRCVLINTPSDFWCQRLDQVPTLEALMERLQKHYSTKTVPLEPETSCCAVKVSSNAKWCRGIITERQNGRARIILVDFGSCIQVTKEECLQGLLPEFCVLGGQAFRCSLYNVIEPLALGWTADATEFLRRFANSSGANLKCNVVSQLNVKNKGLCNVVHLCNTESNQIVSNLLVENSLAQGVTRTLSPTVFPESFVYSSYGLTEGSEEQVFVTHVHSHFELFCQLEKNTVDFEEIDAKISEVQKVKQADAETVVDKLCLAKYHDGKWYRGIAYPAQSPSHVCVTFVDYGNTMITEKKHVVFIPKEATVLLNKPMLALKFSLAGVPQRLVFAYVSEWLHTAVLNKQVRAVILAKMEDGSFEVELFDGEVSINERLKELIHSLTPKPKIDKACNIRGNEITKNTSKGRAKTSPISNTQRKKKSQNKSNKSSPNKRTRPVKSPQSKKPDKVTQTAEPSDWPSPPEPQTNSAIQDNKEFEPTFKTEHYTPFQIPCLSVIKLTEGSKLTCFATHIDSLRSFFLQRSSDEANIFQMTEDLNSSSFRETLEPCTNVSLKVDDLVLAEYEEDGALYRAVVKENIDSCTFKVEFVDFGNSSIVGKEKMFVMAKDNVSQPRYSIPCSLLHCSAFDDTAAFTDAVTDKPLIVEFVCYKKSQWEVKVEILDATTSVPVEAAAPKETDTVPEVTKTQTKPNIKKHVRRGIKRKQPNKVNTVEVFSAFLPPKIQRGDAETGLVLSVLSSGDFYFRLDKSGDSFAALESLMAVNFKNCEPILTNDIKKGLNCLVQEQNGKPCCRAVVKDVSHDACLVHLLDYGKIETVSKSTLRQMMNYLTKIPPFAVHCRLNLQRGSAQDRQMCYDALKAIEGYNVKLVFVNMSEKQLWFVEMVMDRLLLHHHISNREKKTELDSARGNESAPEQDLPQKLAFAPVELNKEYCGFAATVTTPFEFCVVLEDLYLISQVSILLDDLQDELQPLPSAHVVPRAGCLVKSESKNKWCRAEILHIDSTLILNLVDYGHDECLSYGDHSKLKKLPECIAQLPKVTYPCVLNTVRPAGAEEQWSDEAAIFFQQCLDQRNLQIFFREEVSDCQWKVDVLANGVHVAKQLVDAGHASYTDIVLGLRFQEQSTRRSPRHQSDEKDSRTLEETEQIFKVESDSSLCMMM